MMQEDFASRVLANQERLSANVGGQFDFIVCGAGTSGCVVIGERAAAILQKEHGLQSTSTEN